MSSVLATALVFLLGAAEPAAPEAPAAPAAPTASAVVEFPGIRIHPAERRIDVDAAFAIVGEGYFLEYLAVAPHGKLHESLFEMRCEPEKLQFGLLLLGLEPRPEIAFQGEAKPLEGPRVAIEAEWGEGAARKRVRVEDLLMDVRLGRETEPVGFAFTGSRFVKTYGSEWPGGPGAAERPPGPAEVFAANVSGSMIAFYHDPDAILDNPLLSGGDVPLLAPTFKLIEVVGWVAGDERLRPAAAKLPPQGTPAVLHLRPL